MVGSDRIQSPKKLPTPKLSRFPLILASVVSSYILRMQSRLSFVNNIFINQKDQQILVVTILVWGAVELLDSEFFYQRTIVVLLAVVAGGHSKMFSTKIDFHGEHLVVVLFVSWEDSLNLQELVEVF